VSNTVVNTTVINNIYNNQTTITEVNYRNAQVANAVTAVPPAVFAQSQSVQRGMVTVSPELLRRGQVMTMAAVAPTPMGIAGGAPATNRKPAQTIQEREVVVRTAPPAAIAPVAQRVDLLQRKPGQPLERAAIVTTTPSTSSANVRVVSQQTPQAVPQGTPRGTGAPPPMAQRSGNDVARPAPQTGRDNAPPNAVPAAPTAAVPPAAMPSRERGGVGTPGVAAPAPAPQPMSRDRGAPTPPAAAVPAPMTPQVVAPPTIPQPQPQSPPRSSPQPDRGRGASDGPQGNRPLAPMPAPSAVAPTPVPAPAAAMPAPAAVAPAPPPRAVPEPTPRTDVPSPQPMTRQREQGPSSRPAPPPQAAPQPTPQAAPQPTPQAMPQAAPQRPAPPAAVAPPQMQRPAAPPAAAPAPAPRPAPAAAPAMQPQAPPQAAPGGGQELQRRGRGSPDDNSKDGKDNKDGKDKK